MVAQKNAGGIYPTSTWERLVPWIVTALATWWACAFDTIVAIDMSGVTILGLLIGTGVIATWGTNPRCLWRELRAQDAAPLSAAMLILVLAVCITISTIVIGRVDFAEMYTRFDPHFETLTPAHMAQGSLLGFLALLLYPHLQLKMLPERLTLLAVACGFVIYLVGAPRGMPIWAAIVVAVLCRVAFHFWCFRQLGLMRASCPSASVRLC